MTTAIRTERRYGVTAVQSPGAVRNLFVLRNSETWDDLLDVMEQCCIEVETALINTDAADEISVLANHKMSKSAWMIFTHMQEKIDSTISRLSLIDQPESPSLTGEEMERENILDPLNYPGALEQVGHEQEEMV